MSRSMRNGAKGSSGIPARALWGLPRRQLCPSLQRGADPRHLSVLSSLIRDISLLSTEDLLHNYLQHRALRRVNGKGYREDRAAIK